MKKQEAASFVGVRRSLPSRLHVTGVRSQSVYHNRHNIGLGNGKDNFRRAERHAHRIGHGYIVPDPRFGSAGFPGNSEFVAAKTRAALIPPNPNELEMAYCGDASTPASRA